MVGIRNSSGTNNVGKVDIDFLENYQQKSSFNPQTKLYPISVLYITLSACRPGCRWHHKIDWNSSVLEPIYWAMWATLPSCSHYPLLNIKQEPPGHHQTQGGYFSGDLVTHNDKISFVQFILRLFESISWEKSANTWVSGGVVSSSLPSLPNTDKIISRYWSSLLRLSFSQFTTKDGKQFCVKTLPEKQNNIEVKGCLGWPEWQQLNTGVGEETRKNQVEVIY